MNVFRLKAKLSLWFVSLIFAPFCFGSPLDLPLKAFDDQARLLLLNGQYQELDEMMAPCLSPAQAVGLDEINCNIRLLSLSKRDLTLLDALLAWNQQDPENYVALINLAEIYSDLGYAMRGNAWAKETHPIDFKALESHAQWSATWAKQAIQVRPDLPYAWANLLYTVGRANNYFSINEDDVFAEAIAQIPASFLLRESYISVSWPRWGGNHVKIAGIVAEAQPYIADNPLLEQLVGLQTYALGYDYLTGYGDIEEDNDQAMILIGRAATEAPDIVFIQLKLHSMHLSMQNYEAADIELIKREYDLMPYFDSRADAMSVYAFHASDRALRLQIRKTLYEANPDDRGDALSYARLLYQMKRFDQVPAVAERGLKQRPYDYGLKEYLLLSQKKLGIDVISIKDDVSFLKQLTVANFPAEESLLSFNKRLIAQYQQTLSKDQLKLLTTELLQLSEADLRARLLQTIETQFSDMNAHEWYALSTLMAEESHCACYLKQTVRDEHQAFKDTERGQSIIRRFGITAEELYVNMVREALSDTQDS